MAFLVSPGVEVKEKDLTNIIPAVSTSIGGFAGIFEWGPCLESTTVSDETDLTSKFGYPRISSNAGSNTRDDWYAAANFLSYSNNLNLVRVVSDEARNAVSEPSFRAEESFYAVFTGTPDGTPELTMEYAEGKSVTFRPDTPTNPESVADGFRDAVQAATSQTATIDSDGVVGFAEPTVAYSVESGDTQPATQNVGGLSVLFFKSEGSTPTGDPVSAASIGNNDEFLVERNTLTNGTVYARYPGQLGNSIGVLIIDANITEENFNDKPLFGTTTASDIFDTKPGTSVWAENNFTTPLKDEVHVVVYTTDATITGNANEVLETYAYLSKAKNAKTADGGQNYYVDVVNDSSRWVYMLSEDKAADSTFGVGTQVGDNVTGTDPQPMIGLLTNIEFGGVRGYNLSGGVDGSSVTDANYTAGYDILNDVETVDVSLLITGRRSKTVQKYVIQIAEDRKDCITFVSPSYQAAVTNPTAQKVVDYFNNAEDGFNSTSYAVFDSSWKRQYDRYNDEYFWTPLNADIAGLCARTDYTNESWFSPAGLNRGFIQNVVKLSFNPNQTDRDKLYPQRVNPVVTFRGQGTLLYGDKTALSRPSAFDRINVRRLFIVLEKAIATAAKYQLFEFNDDITRRVFVNAVEPFLADIKSRRGVTDFKVVCDTSNNTSEVIDNNRFVADIYIKPTRSINFMTLNFVAVRSGVSFSEIAGA